MSKTKLELTWIGKDKRPKLVPRILLEDPSLSYHAKFRRDPAVLMIETKSQAEMTDAIVQAKADAASQWCQNASEYLLKNAGKAWKYLLIPHDEVKENFQLEDFSKRFQLTPNHCN